MAPLPGFRSTPEPVRASGLLYKAGDLVRRVAESMDYETLDNSGSTSAENQTSVITLFDFGSETLLLTADAGIEALDMAADRLDLLGYGRPTAVQVPHHGSRHYVGPGILDRLVGPRLNRHVRRSVALVSASANGAPKHPARQVTDALRRRGAHTFATLGKQLSWGNDAPTRPGWTPAQAIPFYDEVDE